MIHLYLIDYFRRWWWAWGLTLAFVVLVAESAASEGDLSIDSLMYLIFISMLLWGLTNAEDQNAGLLKVFRALPLSEKQIARAMWLRMSVILPIMMFIGFLAGAFIWRNINPYTRTFHTGAIWYRAAHLCLVSGAILSMARLTELIIHTGRSRPVVALFWAIVIISLFGLVILTPVYISKSPLIVIGIIGVCAASLCIADFVLCQKTLQSFYDKSRTGTSKKAKHSKTLMNYEWSGVAFASPYWSAFKAGLLVVGFIFGIHLVFNLIAGIRPLWKMQGSTFGLLIVIGGYGVLQLPSVHWMSAMRTFGSLPLSGADKTNLLIGIPFVTALPLLAMTLLVHPLESLGPIGIVWYAAVYLLLVSFVFLSTILRLRWGHRSGTVVSMIIILATMLLAIVPLFTLSGGEIMLKSNSLGIKAYITFAAGLAMLLGLRSWMRRMLQKSSAPYRGNPVLWSGAAQR